MSMSCVGLLENSSPLAVWIVGVNWFHEGEGVGGVDCGEAERVLRSVTHLIKLVYI